MGGDGYRYSGTRVATHSLGMMLYRETTQPGKGDAVLFAERMVDYFDEGIDRFANFDFRLVRFEGNGLDKLGFIHDGYIYKVYKGNKLCGKMKN